MPINADQKFSETHNIYPVERLIHFPLNVDPDDDLSVKGVVKRHLGGSIFDARYKIKDIIGWVKGSPTDKAIDVAIKCYDEYQYQRDIVAPYKKYFNFDVQDFVVLTGYNKFIDNDGIKRLATQDWEKISGKTPGINTKDDTTVRTISRILSGAHKDENKQEELFSNSELSNSDLADMVENKDVISAGGPIPIDCIYEGMAKSSFPCNYELKNPELFCHDPCYTSPEKDPRFKKYEIKISDNCSNRLYDKFGANEFIPMWNEYNYGLITIVNKEFLFNGGSGVLINVSGCNWAGTVGAGSYFHDRKKSEELIKLLDTNLIKSGQNVQFVVKVPLNPSGFPLDHTTIVDRFTF